MSDRTARAHGRRALITSVLVILGFAALPSISAQNRRLSFSERVSAQEAIERVYYSHQVGATRPYEEAVPRAVLEAKVRTYLKQSVALEEFWNTPVTSEMLQAELERMVQGSRMPGRLHELFAALGNDPFLIQECLARPALVGRLVRNFFAYDHRIHATARREAEELQHGLSGGWIDPFAAHPDRTESWLEPGERGPEESRERQESRDPFQERDPRGPHTRLPQDGLQAWPEAPQESEARQEQVGTVGPLLEGRDRFLLRAVLERKGDAIRVATFAIPKRGWQDWWREVEPRWDGESVRPVASGRPAAVWEAPVGECGSSVEWHDPGPATGAQAASASDCADDTWDNGSLDDFPSPRHEHTAVWTGTHMLVWGGMTWGVSGDYFYHDTGGRYDPATDTWARMSTVNAPQAREDHTAVWTGSRMVVWGGWAYDASAGRFSAVNTGGAYDPASDTWTPVTSSNAPEGRRSHLAVWTGSVMVVWGGSSETSGLDTGGRYDPITDTWSPTSTTNAPSVRGLGASVWTGRYLVVWGGSSGTALLNTGGRYDPVSDTWTPTTTINAPSGRMRHTAVWTGSQMVVWGGFAEGGVGATNGGGRYDPATDRWAPISTTGAPAPRLYHSAVWTGREMVVWGGKVYDSHWVYLTTGGRYDPLTDTWSPTSDTNAPYIREAQTAVWTGSHMVIWGGFVSGNMIVEDFQPAAGGRYDPATDSWTPTSTSDAPSGRTDHTAVWTGSLMVVWGGHTENDWTTGTLEYYHDTGGRYDPATDSWTPTSITGAPSGRAGHAAVWTGDLMVVWGGGSYDTATGTSSIYDTGGRYDPVTDGWAATSTTDAPLGRTDHTAVWTGSQMVVWGGISSVAPTLTPEKTGGRYDPTTDTWLSTSVRGAPKARTLHTAVWNGSRMVVWGGVIGGGVTSTGGQYDPIADTWSPTALTNAPEARGGHTAVWTGTRMIVWGGSTGVLISSGGRYDPVTDTWTATSNTDAPSPRWRHRAVWSGRLMIVWGGYDSDISGLHYLASGGRYDPESDSWAPVSTTDAPSARYAHQAVWADGLMLVWGGNDGNDGLDTNTGGRYCACVDTTYYLDADGDGYGDPDAAVASCTQPTGYVTDGTDCDDGEATVWKTPGEVLELLFVDASTLSWAPPAETGATAVVYDAIRSGNPADFAAGAMCILSDGPATTVTDPGSPAQGFAFFYLARAQNGCPLGEGSLGASSDGSLRTGRSCP